jgi:hypothetical protein
VEGPAAWVACADLLTLDEVEAAFGAPVEVLRDETSAPRDVEDAAAVQGGLASCDWGVGTDLEGAGSLWLAVLPNAAAEFEETAEGAYGVDAPRESGLRATCAPSGDAATPVTVCSGGILDGSTWIEIGSEYSGEADDATRVAELEDLVALVADRLPADGAPESPWPPGEDALDVAPLCADDGAVWGAVVFDVEPAAVQEAGIGGFDGMLRWPFERAGLVRCAWGEADLGSFTGFSALPGGAWAAERWEASAPVLTGRDGSATREPVEIAGADAAYLGCVDAMCGAYLSVGGSLIGVSLDPGDREATEAALERLVAALQGS